ncbi:MAG: DUF4123 domain-containing protein [Candidatus Eisenbacteria bacterium]|uniref:DUF4123 domain-containing protein n=1 Tax=Eiseniibacteriota bacterium TaxID=2212470 RepID=A0A948W3X6_UNCEI|nr:DUF4123 domain-containing protein [Candidatus Eisenbacteria bacterium]MBU1950782.1 DUF4123 domain-containing protein [Candidatus Eisenbacteria bacterium]MBU2691582.1 DUF4123 domain-containing protein [Candidatus Eisenbacteria bacterium]
MAPSVSTTEFIVQQIFLQPDTAVFGLYDAASAQNMPQILKGSRSEFICLYRGDLTPDMAEVAPYMVKLQKGALFNEWLVRQGWSRNWGLFVTTPESITLQEVATHFRRFLLIRDPEGRRLYFRFYDPRVMRVYLPSCNPEELKNIFGPVGHFFIEDEDPSALLRMNRDGEGLHIQRLMLETAN